MMGVLWWNDATGPFYPMPIPSSAFGSRETSSTKLSIISKCTRTDCVCDGKHWWLEKLNFRLFGRPFESCMKPLIGVSKWFWDLVIFGSCDPFTSCERRKKVRHLKILYILPLNREYCLMRFEESLNTRNVTSLCIFFYRLIPSSFTSRTSI